MRIGSGSPPPTPRNIRVRSLCAVPTLLLIKDHPFPFILISKWPKSYLTRMGLGNATHFDTERNELYLGLVGCAGDSAWKKFVNETRNLQKAPQCPCSAYRPKSFYSNQFTSFTHFFLTREHWELYSDTWHSDTSPFLTWERFFEIENISCMTLR